MKKKKRLNLVPIYFIVCLVVLGGFIFLMTLKNNSSGNVIYEESLLDYSSGVQFENIADNNLINYWTFNKTLNDSAGVNNAIHKVAREKSFVTNARYTYKYLELETVNPFYINGIKNESIVFKLQRFTWINNGKIDGPTGGNIIEFGNLSLPDTFTISVWFNTSASNENSNNNRIIGDRGTASRIQRGFHITAGTKQSFIVANGTANAEIILQEKYNDTQWHNLIASYDKTTGKMDLYIDGILKKSIVKPLSGNINGEYPLTAGGLAFYQYKNLGYKIADYRGKMIDVSNQVVIYHAFTGRIDDLKIYNKILSNEEIKKSYSFCKENIECNDNNNFNVDICKDAGTPNSKCVYEPIPCQKTNANGNIYPDISKCGAKEVVNDEVYCSKFNKINSLVKKYRVPTCNSVDLNKIRKAYPDYKIPENTHYFCSGQIKEELVKKCPHNQCSDGKCITPSPLKIKCYDDFQCDDGNLMTQDNCVNKGTTESYCTNEAIEEVVSVPCTLTVFGNTCNGGKNRLWGSPYCDGNVAIKDYIWFECIKDPGKTTRHCESRSKKFPQRICDFKTLKCVNGVCVKK